MGREVLRRVAVGMLERERERPAPDLDHEWMQRQQAKLRAAEKIANSLTGEELKKQRQRIAGLKRSITLGPEGLRRAAAKAHARRHTTTPA